MSTKDWSPLRLKTYDDNKNNVAVSYIKSEDIKDKICIILKVSM